MRDYLMRFPRPVYAPDDAAAAGGAGAAGAAAGASGAASGSGAAAVAGASGAAGATGTLGNLIAGATAAAATGATGTAGTTGATAGASGATGGATGTTGTTGATGAAAAIEYTDFKVPDGIELGKEAVGEFKTLAGELKLDQAGAQKLVDLYTKSAMEAANAPYKLWEETQANWQKEVKADPEIGGANTATTFSNIAKLIDRFGGKEAAAIRGAFEFTGSGNNPEVIRFLARVGKVFAENPNVTGRAPTTQQDRASRMFPSLAAKAAG